MLMAAREVIIISRAEISVAVSRRDCSLTGRRSDAIDVKVKRSLAVRDCAADITGVVLGRERR